MANQATLSGVLAEKRAKRFTPAGVPVLECLVEHSATVQEAGSERSLEFSIKAKAMGPAAERLEQVALGSKLIAQGFLAPARQHSKQIVFHLTNFELE